MTSTRLYATRKHSRLGIDLIDAIQEVVDIERGKAKPRKVVRVLLNGRDATAAPAPDYSPSKIKRLRKSLELSQPVFAAALNVRPMTLRGWEQGTRKPETAAVRLLQLTEQHLEWVLAMVSAR